MSPFSSHLLSWASGLAAPLVASSQVFSLFSSSAYLPSGEAVLSSVASISRSNRVLRPMWESPEQSFG